MNTPVVPPRPRGRPRSPVIDGAILDATLELLVKEGVERTTIGAVAARAGVARATIYLRWRSREALIGAAFVHAKGRQPFLPTGDIETDLATGAEWARAVFSEPVFRAVLPLVMEVLLRPRRSEATMTYDQLAPNRLRLVEEYRRTAAAAGLRTDVDELMVMDLIVGGLLIRLLATGSPPTYKDAEQAVEIVVNGIRTPDRIRRAAKRRPSSD